MNSLPLDAEPLAVENCWVWAEATYYEIRFFLYRRNNLGYVGSFNVGSVKFPEVPTWRIPRPEEFRARLSVPGFSNISANYALALSEIYAIMAGMSEILEEGYADKIAEAKERAAKEEAEREERAAQRRAEEAIRHRERHLERLRLDARRSHIFELIKWQLGEKIKLTRDGYRATVFGTIDHVEPSFMNLTTEKGKFMRIMFKDINHLWIKEGAARRYDKLYTAGDEPEPEPALEEQTV